MAEYEHRQKQLRLQVEQVVRSAEIDEDFFRSIGDVAAVAIFRRDTPSLSSLYDGLRNGPCQDPSVSEGKKYRIEGGLFLLDKGQLKIHELESETQKNPQADSAEAVSERESKHLEHKMLLRKITKRMLEGIAEPADFKMLAQQTVTAIIMVNREELRMSHGYLLRLTREAGSAALREGAQGMLDIAKPALHRMDIFTTPLESKKIIDLYK